MVCIICQIAQAAKRAGLNPATDVEWVTNAAQPDLLKMLGVGQLDAMETASQFAKRSEDDGIGRIIADRKSTRLNSSHT